MKHITLNNGVKMPSLGLGVFETPPDETCEAVRAALDCGYGLIDPQRPTATSVRAARPSTAQTWTAWKSSWRVWISDYGYDETLHAFEKSARKLGVEQIDLLILHLALPSSFDRTLDA